MRVVLGNQLIVPQELASTNQRPNLVLWSETQQVVHFVVLTVPREDAVEMVFERKNLKSLLHHPLKAGLLHQYTASLLCIKGTILMWGGVIVDPPFRCLTR